MTGRKRLLRIESLEIRRLYTVSMVTDYPADYALTRSYFGNVHAVFDDKILLEVDDDTHGTELWAVERDGTATVSEGVEGSAAEHLTKGVMLEGHYYFGAVDDSPFGRRSRIRSTDGTVAGTSTYHTFDDTYREAINFAGASDDAFFVYTVRGLLSFDATASGTTEIIGPRSGLMTPFKHGALVFADSALWWIERTEAVRLAEINGGWRPHLVTEEVAWLSTEQGIIVTDGTVNGTRLVGPVTDSTRLVILCEANGVVLTAVPYSDYTELYEFDPLTDQFELVATRPGMFRRGNAMGARVVFTTDYDILSYDVRTRTFDVLVESSSGNFVADAETAERRFYLASNGLLWSTDGTIDGTHSLARNARSIAASQEAAYFSTTLERTVDIWKSSGLPDNGRKLFSLESDAASYYHPYLHIESGFVLVSMYETSNLSRGWIASEDDDIFHEISLDEGNDTYIGEILPVNDGLIYTYGRAVQHLWFVNSDLPMAVRLRDDVYSTDSTYQQLFVFGDQVAFRGSDGLWVTDGTDLEFITSLVSFVRFSTPSALFSSGYLPNDHYSTELRTDVESRQTREIRPEGFPTGTILRSFISPNFVFLATYQGIYRGDHELGGLTRLTSSNCGIEWTQLFRDAFIGHNCDLGYFLADGVSPPKHLSSYTFFEVLTEPRVVGDFIYFVAWDRALWKTDGSQENTSKVRDVASKYVVSTDRKLYFTSYDLQGRTQLWETDGTTTGTRPSHLVPPGMGLPRNIVDMAGTTYFTLVTPEEGEELWRFDSVTQQSVLVADLHAGAQSSSPLGFQAVGNNLYFFANDGLHGRQLWRIKNQVGDFTHDGRFTPHDLDALSAGLARGSNDTAFDLNGDKQVTPTDLTDWLTLAGMSDNHTPYLVGDSNLDGLVDGTDFGTWQRNQGTQQVTWSHGNFNGDDRIDTEDYQLWANHRFQGHLTPTPSGRSVPRGPLAAAKVDAALAEVSKSLVTTARGSGLAGSALPVSTQPVDKSFENSDHSTSDDQTFHVLDERFFARKRAVIRRCSDTQSRLLSSGIRARNVTHRAGLDGVRMVGLELGCSQLMSLNPPHFTFSRKWI